VVNTFEQFQAGSASSADVTDFVLRLELGTRRRRVAATCALTTLKIKYRHRHRIDKYLDILLANQIALKAMASGVIVGKAPVDKGKRSIAVRKTSQR